MDQFSASVTFDHLAYLARDTAQSVEAFRPFFPEITLLRQAHKAQGAYITYLSTADGRITIELVEPFQHNKLLADRLDREKSQCLPYHIALAVNDFQTAYNRMRRHGWLTLTRPFEGFSSVQRAAHLYKSAAGIVEIVGNR
jgi:methylmalonyl-CoA/ethylmalonyl-CoA epimerase